MDIQGFFDPATFTVTYLVTYLVTDPKTKAAAIIDPVLDFDPNTGKLSTMSINTVLAEVAARGLTLQWVLDTHAHADHLSAADYVQTDRRTLWHRC